jgi:hypothetical protein
MKTTITSFLLLLVATSANQYTDAWYGIVDGLQRNVTDPSTCIQSYPIIVDNWTNFTSVITSDWVLAVNELRDVTSALNDLVAECHLTDGWEKIKNTFTAQGFGAISVQIGFDYVFYTSNLDKMSKQLDDGNYTDFGLLFGQTFSKLYSFYI